MFSLKGLRFYRYYTGVGEPLVLLLRSSRRNDKDAYNIGILFLWRLPTPFCWEQFNWNDCVDMWLI